jgi:hypothetical protein
MINGKLPWPGGEDNEQTLRIKRTLSTAEICGGMPDEYQRIGDYLKALEFAQQPDYQMLKDLLREMLRSVPASEQKWDWENVSKEDLDRMSPISLKMPAKSHVEVDALDQDIACACNVM